MSDTNYNSGNNNQEQTDKSNQNANSYSPSEDGSTYWESHEVQNSFDIPSEHSMGNNDFNQEVEDYTYDEFQKKQYGYQQKKKSRKKIIAGLIVLILLLGSVTTAYGFSSTLRNTIDLLLKSPRDYYVQLENKELKGLVDKSKAYEYMSKAENSAMNATASLSYDKETIGAMLQTYLGTTISDLEALIGIPLDSIGLDIISANNENAIYQKIGLELNTINIISSELFFDTAAKEMLIYFPELSEAYLNFSLNESLEDNIDFDGFSKATNIITSDRAKELIKRYGKLITEQVEDVELSKKEQLTVGDITVESNLLTVSFYPETFKNILTSVLEEAKNDDFILDLLQLFEVSREEYQSEIDHAIADAKYSFDSMPQDEELMVMNVYVGRDGDIIGRKITIPENNNTLGLFYVEDKNKGEYEFYIDTYNENEFRVTGGHTKKDGAYTGALTFETIDKIDSTESFSVEYEDFKLEPKNNRMYAYGSFNIFSNAMMGAEVVIELDAKNDTQFAVIKLNLGKSSLVTLETSAKHLEDFTIPQADKNAEIFDAITETDGYALTIDIDAYISSLSDRLGLDLEGLLGSLLQMY